MNRKLIIWITGFLLLLTAAFASANEDFSISAPAAIHVFECAPASSQMTVLNTGSIASRYSIAMDGEGASWSAVIPLVFTLEPGKAQAVNEYFKIPCTTSGTYPITTYITTDSGEQRILEQDIAVEQPNNIQLFSVVDTQKTKPGQSAKYLMQLRNPVNFTETYNLSVIGQAISAAFSDDVLTLMPGEQKNITLEVLQDDNAKYGVFPLAIQIDALNSGTSQAFDLGYEVLSNGIAEITLPSKIVTNHTNIGLKYTIKNIGSTDAEYALGVDGADFVTPQQNKVTIKPGETSSQMLLIKPTSDTPDDTYTVTVSATAKETGQAYQSSFELILGEPSFIDKYLMVIAVSVFALFVIVFIAFLIVRKMRSPEYQQKMQKAKAEKAAKAKREKAREARIKARQEKQAKQAKQAKAVVKSEKIAESASKPKSSIWKTILTIIIILAVLAGLGFAGYSFRDALIKKLTPYQGYVALGAVVLILLIVFIIRQFTKAGKQRRAERKKQREMRKQRRLAERDARRQERELRRVARENLLIELRRQREGERQERLRQAAEKRKQRETQIIEAWKELERERLRQKIEKEERRQMKIEAEKRLALQKQEEKLKNAEKELENKKKDKKVAREEQEPKKKAVELIEDEEHKEITRPVLWLILIAILLALAGGLWHFRNDFGIYGSYIAVALVILAAILIAIKIYNAFCKGKKFAIAKPGDIYTAIGWRKGLAQVVFKISKQVENLQVDLRRGKPDDSFGEPGTVFQYYTIKSSSQDCFAKANAKFIVPKKWLAKNNIAVSGVFLAVQGINKRWKKLDAKLEGTDGKNTYYSTELDEIIGIYAIAGISKDEKKMFARPAAKKIVDKTPADKSRLWLWITGIILVLLLAGLSYFALTQQPAEHPYFQGIPDQTWSENTDYYLNLTAYITDPDKDMLKFTVGKQPQHISIDISDAGMARLIPEKDWNGQELATFIAKDTKNATFETPNVKLQVTKNIVPSEWRPYIVYILAGLVLLIIIILAITFRKELLEFLEED